MVREHRNMEREVIKIPTIVLEWSQWVTWEDLRIDARGGQGIRVPNRKSGVYEARCKLTEERLTIGKASDLRMRVKQGLVKGKIPHSSGKKIRDNENVSRIVVRWAVTERPAAAEEALHRKYHKRFSRFPKYTDHT
jgi:hypothetical protein